MLQGLRGARTTGAGVGADEGKSPGRDGLGNGLKLNSKKKTKGEMRSPSRTEAWSCTPFNLPRFPFFRLSE